MNALACHGLISLRKPLEEERGKKGRRDGEGRKRERDVGLMLEHDGSGFRWYLAGGSTQVT